MSNWSKKEIDERVKTFNNEKLLDETINAMGGDDYDGCFTPKGEYYAKVLVEELKNRLKDWLNENHK